MIQVHSLGEAALVRIAVLCYHRGEQEFSLSHVSFIGFVPFHLLLHALSGEGSAQVGAGFQASVPVPLGARGLECLLLCGDM